MDTSPLPTQPQTDTTASFAASLAKENHENGSAQKFFLPALIGVILLGIGTGYAIASRVAPASQSVAQTATETTTEKKTADVAGVKVGQVFGAKDGSAFKDSAEGVLVAGGVGGEGSHHIARPGGPSQNVYLTSSVVDLKLFEGHKVKVSGETFKAQRAGWLMDVGRVEVKELNAQLPDGAVPPEALGND